MSPLSEPETPLPEPYRQVLEDAARQVERMKSLWRLVTRHDASDEERIAAFLATAAENLGMDVAVVGDFTDVYTALYVHDRLGAVKPGMVIPLNDTFCRFVHEGRAPMAIPDVGVHPQLCRSEVATRLGIHAYLGVPVRVGEGVHHVLSFFSRKPMAAPFGEADIAFAELMAAWLGSFLYQRRQRDLLERLALTDPLTGLLNRRAAEKRLAEELARAKRSDEGFALALVDLDRFKSVNDRYGHAIGDQVLKGLAARLQGTVRNEDWLARWGGEEFLIFLRRADAREALYVMERIAQQVRARPFDTEVGSIAMTVSAGIGFPSRDDPDIQVTLTETDACLYQAKAGGRDRVEAHSRPGGILWMAQAVKQAVREQRIRLATQAIVDLESGEVVADESLARIVAPDGRAVEAREFIETAEGLGLMVEVDRQMTAQAMARCTRLLAGGARRPDFAHFVNLSPQFLARKELVMETLAAAQCYCQTCGVDMGPVKPIVFEITERQFLANLDSLEADLEPLLDFGFRLALDDFGSGYSSFLYLARLPISFLKIEGWMVANLRRDGKIAAMVESIAAFARSQGIVTVAECIEDEETARILRQMGVDWGQGWHFGRPEIT